MGAMEEKNMGIIWEYGNNNNFPFPIGKGNLQRSYEIQETHGDLANSDHDLQLRLFFILFFLLIVDISLPEGENLVEGKTFHFPSIVAMLSPAVPKLDSILDNLIESSQNSRYPGLPHPLQYRCGYQLGKERSWISKNFAQVRGNQPTLKEHMLCASCP